MPSTPPGIGQTTRETGTGREDRGQRGNKWYDRARGRLDRHWDSPRFGARVQTWSFFVPQLVGQAAGRGDGLDGEAVFEAG